MLRRPRGGALLAALATLIAGRAAGGAGVIGVLDLVEPARSQGLGGAGTAVGNDPTLAGVNPAAGANVARPTVSVAGQRRSFGESVGQGLVAFPALGGSLSLTVAYLDAGTLALATPDGGLAHLALQRDVAVSAIAARPFGKRVTAGIAVKVLESELFADFRARTVAGDAGVQVLMDHWLKAGVAIQNLGGSLDYAGERQPLNATVRAGLAAAWKFGGATDVIVFMADVLGHNGGAVSVRGGAEYLWNGVVSLRAGAKLAGTSNLSSMSAGFGFNRGVFRVDYGVRFGSAFELPHAIALTLRL